MHEPRLAGADEPAAHGPSAIIRLEEAPTVEVRKTPSRPTNKW